MVGVRGACSPNFELVELSSVGVSNCGGRAHSLGPLLARTKVILDVFGRPMNARPWNDPCHVAADCWCTLISVRPPIVLPVDAVPLDNGTRNSAERLTDLEPGEISHTRE